jgi:hypothetical protein
MREAPSPVIERGLRIARIPNKLLQLRDSGEPAGKDRTKWLILMLLI